MKRRSNGGDGPPMLPGGVIDLGALRRKGQIEAAIEKAGQQSDEERWTGQFTAAADAGPVHLLAFMLRGAVYNEDTVHAAAAQLVAGFVAGGYMIVRHSELESLIGDTVRELREKEGEPGAESEAPGEPAD